MGEKPSQGTYQTFSSGESVVIPDGEEVKGQDSMEGLDNYCANAVDDEQGSIPEVKSVKR